MSTAQRWPEAGKERAEGVGKKKRESRRKSERKGFDANGEREKSGGKREKGQEERKGQ